MLPYYDDGGVVIYHGDCREVAPEIDGFDLLVMDPPFDEWRHAPRIIAPTVIAFTSWQHRAPVYDLYGTPRCELIWNFDDGRWVSHSLPRITHENIYIFGQTGSAYVCAPDGAKTRRAGTCAIGRKNLGPRTYRPRERKSLNSVLRYPRHPSTALGVWSKPLGLMTTLLEWCGGTVVLDPYTGSGTTLLAAKNLGLRAIGIEIKEQHCEIAARRLSQEVLELGA